MLPDNVLLETFDFYVEKSMDGGYHIYIVEWIMLAHVCRRWRSVVFQSPHRLNLRLLCTIKTPARDTLDIWPALPLVIRGILDYEPSEDNIIAALEHNDRVCKIDLHWISSSEFECVTNCAAMQKPFPELTDLLLYKAIDDGPILSDSFLDGTAPRLRSLYLHRVPFPGLPNLLLSATHLVRLDLYGILRLGYIPQEAMATGLSALTGLEFLRLYFIHPPPRPVIESRQSPPPTRFILPSLTKIRFRGASEYL